MFRFQSLIFLTACWYGAIFLLQNQVDLSLWGITIHPVVNIILPVLLLVALLYRPVMRLPFPSLVLLVEGLYLVAKVLVRPELSDVNVLLESMAVEFLVLFVTTWLVWNLARWFYDYHEQIIESIQSPITTRVKNTFQEVTVIDQRIAAARRFGRDVTLLHLQFPDHLPIARGRSWANLHGERDVMFELRLAELINFLTGAGAVSSWYQQDLVVCLSPDDQPDALQKLACEIHEVLQNVLKLDVSVGVARFPTDGLVLADLVERGTRSILVPAAAPVRSENRLRTLSRIPLRSASFLLPGK